MTITLAEAITRMGVDVHDHLDRDDPVPVLAGLQIQGDVAIVPTRPSEKPGTLVPPEGVPVVRGENGGHTHLLLADGKVYWAPTEGRSQDLGVITVPEGTTAFLAHPEHGYLGLASNTYICRRQREQADEIRLVAD